MGIIYNEEAKEFHLYNRNVSYIMNIMKNNQLGQICFGKRTKNRDSFSDLMEMDHRPMTSYPFKGDLYFSLEHMRQEYPTYGSGDYKRHRLDISRKQVPHKQLQDHRLGKLLEHRYAFRLQNSLILKFDPHERYLRKLI